MFERSLAACWRSLTGISVFDGHSGLCRAHNNEFLDNPPKQLRYQSSDFQVTLSQVNFSNNKIRQSSTMSFDIQIADHAPGKNNHAGDTVSGILNLNGPNHGPKSHHP